MTASTRPRSSVSGRSYRCSSVSPDRISRAASRSTSPGAARPARRSPALPQSAAPSSALRLRGRGGGATRARRAPARAWEGHGGGAAGLAAAGPAQEGAQAVGGRGGGRGPEEREVQVGQPRRPGQEQGAAGNLRAVAEQGGD